ncbi:girdin-like, partial [Hemiscyllium ocellatum]
MELSGRAGSTRRRSVLKSDSQLSYKLQQFMQSPLVSWVRTFEASLDGDDGQYMEVKALGRTDCQADYLKLVDGVFLNRVMRQIDTNPQTQRIYHNAGNDEVVRVQNLTILVQQIKSFYQEDLQQLILMDLPNVQLLGRDPLSDAALQELEKMLLLLLGCAVQCEDKEEFIGRIQTLDLDVQTSVARHIQEITQNRENLVSVQCGDLASSSVEELHLLFGNMVQHLKELVNQRDENMERIAELIQERELCQLHHGSGAGNCEGGTGHRSGESREHLTVQLVDSKSKLRRLRQELQEKSEELEDCNQELEELQSAWKQLQKQNRELMLEARAARTYRDEVDILREKATRVDRLQSEVKAYKERLNSIEFYRGKVEEEREYSRALLETKTILEEQLEAARARCDRLHQLEKEGLLLRTALNDLEMEREADQKRIEELMEENLTLEIQASKTQEEDSRQQRWRTESLSEGFPHSEFTLRPLSDEVNEVTSAQLMRLERENQELRKKAEEFRNAHIEADSSQSVKMVSLERENQQLQKMMERLQAEVAEEKENTRNIEGMSNDLMMEKDRMERTMQILRENSEREVEELRLERDQLRQTVEALRQRSQVSSEARVKDIEKENAILHQAMAEAGLRQSTLASERNQALLELEQSRALAEKAEALSQELGRIRLLNEELRERATELESSLGRLPALEEKASGLQAENGRLRQSLEAVTERLEASERERARCEEESLRLREADGAALEQAETENRELGRERDRLRREAARLEGDLARGQEQALAYRAAQSELQQLRRSLEGTRGRLSELEQEAEESEGEAQRRQRELEEQRAACGLLEQARQALEQELEQTEGERRQLAKENRRLRQHAQSRDTSLEEQSQRAAGLELENRRLLQEISRAQEDRDSLAEALAGNSQLQQQLAASKGEASGLREDLMNEKLRAQGLSNQLDSLSHKLERMGIEQGQVLPAGEESSFRLLEERLDSVFKDTLTIRETHIANLRSQLEDAGRRNQELSDQLQELQRELEKPAQRDESLGRTVAMTMEGEAPSEAKSERREFLREVSSDRLIEVERKNATLLAEKEALTVALGQQESVNGSLQAQIVVLQKHTVSLQEQNGRLQ